MEHHLEEAFLFLAVLVMAGKVLGSIVERRGQSAVLGELAAGVLLSALGYFGLGAIDEMRHNEVLAFCAELGAVLLLFSVGLESNIKQMRAVGANAALVAGVGAVIPFAVGAFLLGPWLFPGESGDAHKFLGAAMVATSVGITASVFNSLALSKTRPAQVVLGAAVIDDVIGLVVLAVVAAGASGGETGLGVILELTLTAMLFLGVAVSLGLVLVGPLSRIFSAIHTGTGMKLGIVFSFALIYAYLATTADLALIVGAFAAGLVLDGVRFSESFDASPVSQNLRAWVGRRSEPEPEIEEIIRHENEHHVEELITTLNWVFVPVFFVYTGLQIDFASVLELSLYPPAILITLVAIAGKVAAGIAAKGGITERLLVGVSMVPRGEVGLIFASVGLSIGAIEGAVFSTILLVVIGTTFVAPFLIKFFSARYLREQGAESAVLRAAS